MSLYDDPWFQANDYRGGVERRLCHGNDDPTPTCYTRWSWGDRPEVDRAEPGVEQIVACPTNHGRTVVTTRYTNARRTSRGETIYTLKGGEGFIPHKTPFCPDCGVRLAREEDA